MIKMDTTKYRFSTKIPILQWKQIYSQEDQLIPVFFFTPTLEFLNITRQYPESYFHIPIYIEGTNHLYDGIVYGIADRITTVGECRSNFDNSLLIYSISLPSVSFTLYPVNNGHFRLMYA